MSLLYRREDQRMNWYEVTVNFRPNINSMDRRTRTIRLRAPNKEVAILMGGQQLGLDRQGLVRDDIKIEVRRA